MKGPLNEARKREILAAVAALLDGLDRAEPLPEGLSAAFVGPDVDLAHAVRAITVEAGEIAADRRARAALVDTVAAQARALEEVRAELVRLREARATELRHARAEDEAALLSVLLDLRDRLHRVATDARVRLEQGVAAGEAPAAVASPTGLRSTAAAWLEWLRGMVGSPGVRPVGRDREVLLAVVGGLDLMLAHLDEALARLGVREIPAAGLFFDPSRMFAVGFARVPGVADGTVTEVERAGYERDGRVVRPARVRVARATNPEEAAAEAEQDSAGTTWPRRTE